MDEQLILNTVNKSPNATKILIADNFPLVRQALKMFINQQNDLEVIADASDGHELLDIVTKLKPDVIITELEMPKVDGLEATKQIIDIYPDVKVLILTDFPGSEDVIDILKAGASGYITKNVTGEEIIHALRVIIGGEKYLPYSTFQNTSQEALKDSPYLLDDLNKLHPRELKILKFAATGMSNKDIAKKLDVSERSVKHSVTAILTKLGVSSRTQAIARGLNTRLLRVSDFNQFQ